MRKKSNDSGIQQLNCSWLDSYAIVSFKWIMDIKGSKKPANVIRRLPVVVTRWRFELQTHCLKGNCSANWASGSWCKKFGAKWLCSDDGWDGRTRTYECQSQSLVPYHLATSQYPACAKPRRGGKWGEWRDSNPRSSEPQSDALTNYATPTIFRPDLCGSWCIPALVRQEGLEPPTYCLEGSCSIQMSYWRIWSEWWESNPRPQLGRLLY